MNEVEAMNAAKVSSVDEVFPALRKIMIKGALLIVTRGKAGVRYCVNDKDFDGIGSVPGLQGVVALDTTGNFLIHACSLNIFTIGQGDWHQYYYCNKNKKIPKTTIPSLNMNRLSFPNTIKMQNKIQKKDFLYFFTTLTQGREMRSVLDFFQNFFKGIAIL